MREILYFLNFSDQSGYADYHKENEDSQQLPNLKLAVQTTWSITKFLSLSGNGHKYRLTALYNDKL